MKKRIIRLQDSFKKYTYDQDKSCSPEETVARFKKRLKENNLDVLKEIKRIDNGRLDIPVYFSVCGKDAEEIIGNKKQMGKGSTPEQSRASACMELAERFSFFSFMRDPQNCITGTYGEMIDQGYPVLPLDKWLLSVHDTTTDEATLHKLIQDIPIQWVWANNLTRNKETLMPFSWFYAINEFNGPSAGNSYEEAMLQGLSEIVERHVCAIISHEKIKTPAIDLASITDPVAKELIEKFTRHGIEIYLNDFSLDTGIPTISALCIDRSTFPETSEIVYTAGTTAGPIKALIRGVTEVAQLSGDFNTSANYIASGLPKPLSMDEVRHVTHPGKTIAIADIPDLSDDNMKVEMENCLQALANIDLEVYVVDITHPGLKIPATYTIVPGCHFRERSRISNVGLFAAKLVSERIDDINLSTLQLMNMREILPDAYYIEFYLAKNLVTQGLPEEALNHFNTALTLNPEEEDIPYIYSFLGDTLKNLGRYKEAITAVNKGREIDDERPDFHNIAGVCYFKLTEYEKAIEHFKRAVHLLPSSAIDYANIGINYKMLGNRDEAVKYFELALGLDPTIEFAAQALIELS
jgi:ribosomal protein S12 methylthiotransferase accessory factor